MGLAFRVLFETSHSGAIEIEIHLPQIAVAVSELQPGQVRELTFL